MQFSPRTDFAPRGRRCDHQLAADGLDGPWTRRRRAARVTARASGAVPRQPVRVAAGGGSRDDDVAGRGGSPGRVDDGAGAGLQVAQPAADDNDDTAAAGGSRRRRSSRRGGSRAGSTTSDGLDGPPS